MLNGIQGKNPYDAVYPGSFGHRAGAVSGPQRAETVPPQAHGSRTVAAATEVKGYRMPMEEESTLEGAGAAVQGIVGRRGVDPVEYAVRMRIQYVDPEEALPGQEKVQGSDGPGAVEDGECQTCEKRKYQDGSNDMGVSFKTPTRIAPEAAGAMVRSHEQEHVSRERAKAEREDRQVVSQSVTLHTDICPECGKVYISGGTTRTTTAARPESPKALQPDEAERRPFSAVA